MTGRAAMRLLGGGCALLLTLIAAPKADAAIILGQNAPSIAEVEDCTAGISVVQAQTIGPNPYVVPDAGVITRFSILDDDPGLARLQVWRPLGGTMYQLVGRSEFVATAPATLRTFDARISAQPGDVLGMRTGSDDIGCAFTTTAGDVVRSSGVSPPDSEPGDVVDFPFPITGNDDRLNVTAVLEPDCDQDGLGDETQDALADCAPPDVQITKSPKDKIKTKKKRAKVTFEFTGTDARAIAGFECSLDGAPFAPCSSPHTVKVKKGKHTFSVRAIDQAGNVDGSPATDTWKVKRKKKKR